MAKKPKTIITTVVLQPGTKAAWFYRRVSHRDQLDGGLGLAAQEAAQWRYYKAELEPRGFVYAGTFVDPAVSASKKRFIQREAGCAVDQTAARGDVILFSIFDRAFRNSRDWENQRASWDARGICVAFIQENWQNYDNKKPNDAFYEMQIGLASLFAAYESRRKSERIKDAKAIARIRGEWQGGRCPVGKKQAGKWLIDCPHERPITREIYRLRSELGWSVTQIYTYLRWRCKAQRRNGRWWTADVIIGVIKREPIWQHKEAERAAATAQHHRKERLRLGLSEEPDPSAVPPFEV